MGLKSIKVAGADQAVTNISGAHYVPSVQATAARSFLYKVSYTNLSGSTVYLWLFDNAAGSGSSTNCIMSRECPAGLSDTWDFETGGTLFLNGIFIAVATGAPAAPTTAPTLVANDAVQVHAAVRVDP